ncbi:MAG TPA: hypothetical protein VFU43_28860 [Streptosporangiaceae bacterium]|nr:hypothetical protein [Streptosporangiaceae bacterium]
MLTIVGGIVILLVAQDLPDPVGGLANGVFDVLGDVADEVTRYLREKGLV